MIYRVTRFLLRIIFRVALRWRVEHPERVPSTGPVILAPNHVSNLDPPIVGAASPRYAIVMAKEELFKNRWVSRFVSALGAYPVRRGKADRQALKRTIDHLQAGGAVLIFPEGTRSRTGDLQPAELGVAMLAYQTGAAVVPIYIQGSREILPPEGRPRLGSLSITFGEPLRFLPEPERKPGREEYQRAADEIMAAIARLRDGRRGT